MDKCPSNKLAGQRQTSKSPHSKSPHSTRDYTTENRWIYRMIKVVSQLFIFVLAVPFVYAIIELTYRAITLFNDIFEFKFKTNVWISPVLSAIFTSILVWKWCENDNLRSLFLKIGALLFAWLITVYPIVDYTSHVQLLFNSVVTSFVYMGPIIATGFSGYMLYLAIRYSHFVPQIATQ